MRTGWNPELAKRLQRPDPAARVIVEGMVAVDEDIRLLQEHWAEATGDPTLQTSPDGSVRLFRNSDGAAVGNTTPPDDYSTDFQADIGFFRVAELTWPQGNPDREITQVRLYLHPRLEITLDQEVVRWKAGLFRLSAYRTGQSGEEAIELAPISQWVEEDAPQSSAPGWVTFGFAQHGTAPTVGPNPEWPEGIPGYSAPRIFVLLKALKAEGAAAANCGWGRDSTVNSVASGGLTLADRVLFPLSGPSAGLYSLEGAGTGLSSVEVFSGSYEEATIGFVSEPNRLEIPDLTDDSSIELVGEGEAPAGSSIEYFVSADGAEFVEYSDGDRVGEGSLSALPRQTFYYLQATLSPGGGGAVSPVLRALGVRAVRTVDLDGLASVATGGWAVDPVTLRGEITEAAITINRDGDRDYRDVGTELLSLYFTKQLAFRVWIGHPDLARASWLLIDTVLIDDYESAGAAVRFDCLSALSLLRTALPVPDTSDPDNVVRAPLDVIQAMTLGAAYSEILDGQIGLPARWRGVGIPTALADVVTKSIEDSDAKVELDGLAFLAGGGIIGSQGRVKYVDMLGARPPVATLDTEELHAESVTPGLRQRVPEFFVPFSWDGGRYAQEIQAVHGPSLASLGSIGLDAPSRLDDDVARWITSDTLALAVGKRTVGALGAGLLLWRFRSVYPHPYLEPGDVVTVRTDQFTARDPNTGRALKGSLWAVAVVQAVHDLLGQEITVWVRGYADIIPETKPITRIGGEASEGLPISWIFEPLQDDELGVFGGLLTINDPDGRVTDIRFATKQQGGAWSALAAGGDENGSDFRTGDTPGDPLHIRSVTITKHPKHPPAVKWLITFVDVDGAVRQSGSAFTYDLDRIPHVGIPAVSFEADGSGKFSFEGDEDTASIVWTAALNTEPSIPDLSSSAISGRTGTVETGLVAALADELVVTVRGVGADGVLAPASEIRTGSAMFGSPAKLRPQFQADQEMIGPDGTLWRATAQVTEDPEKTFVRFEFDTNDDGTWEAPFYDSSDEHYQSAAIALAVGEAVMVPGRMIWNDGKADRTTNFVVAISPTGGIYSSYALFMVNGAGKISVRGGQDIVRAKIAFSTVAPPTATEVRAQPDADEMASDHNFTVLTPSPVQPGETLYWAALGYNASDVETALHENAHMRDYINPRMNRIYLRHDGDGWLDLELLGDNQAAAMAFVLTTEKEPPDDILDPWNQERLVVAAGARTTRLYWPTGPKIRAQKKYFNVLYPGEGVPVWVKVWAKANVESWNDPAPVGDPSMEHLPKGITITRSPLAEIISGPTISNSRVYNALLKVDANADGVPDGIDPAYGGGVSLPDISIDTTVVPPSGTSSMRVEGGGHPTQPSDFFATDAFPVEPGEELVMEVDFYGEDVEALRNLKIVGRFFTDPAVINLGDEPTNPASSVTLWDGNGQSPAINTWLREGATVTVPEGATVGRVAFEMVEHLDDEITLWFDAIFVCPSELAGTRKLSTLRVSRARLSDGMTINGRAIEDVIGSQEKANVAKDEAIVASEPRSSKSTTAPVGPAVNDLWIDTSTTPNVWKRWSGSAWIKITPSTASEVGAEKGVHKSGSAPVGAATGDLWLDTSTTPNVLKRWTGVSWAKATPTNADEIGETTSKKWAAESGATVGATAGTNLKDSSGATLGDADVVTSEGTAADTVAVGGIESRVVAASAQTAYLDSFHALPPLAAFSAPASVSIVSGVGVTGGQVLQATAYTTYYPSDLIPFDPSKLYRIRIRVRVTQQTTSRLLYAGVRGFDASRALLTGPGSSGNLYLVASARSMTVAGGWVEYTGWLKGTGAYHVNAWDPRFPSGTASTATVYIAPMVLLNYSGGGQTMQLDYFSIDVLDEDAMARIYNTIRSDGALEEAVGQYDGAGARVIAKGHVSGLARDGDLITFPLNFNNPPLVLIYGGINYEPRSAQWSPIYDATKPQYSNLAAVDVTASNFYLRAELLQKSNIVARTAQFPSGNSLTAVGHTAVATVANAPAQGDQYTIHYAVTELGSSGSGNATMVVAVDSSSDGGSTWVERSTKTYIRSITAPGTIPWPDESQTVTVSGLDSTDKIRVRLKSLSTSGGAITAAVHAFDGTGDAGPAGITYEEATEATASMTPETNDRVYWEALAVS